MDSHLRILMLVDVPVISAACEASDDSLVGCLQALREIQASEQGKHVTWSYSLFDSLLDTDPIQLQELVRQHSFSEGGIEAHACSSPWHPCDHSSWVRFRKHALAAMAFCNKYKGGEHHATGLKNDENQMNSQQKTCPLLQRCLARMNPKQTQDELFICVISSFPSDESGWKAVLGTHDECVSKPLKTYDGDAIAQGLNRLLPTQGWLSSSWWLIDCGGRGNVVTALQSSALSATQVFSQSGAAVKATRYLQLCELAMTGASASSVTQAPRQRGVHVPMSVHGFAEFSFSVSWRPSRTKNTIQELSVYCLLPVQQVERCLSVQLGFVSSVSSAVGAHNPFGGWLSFLSSSRYAAIAIAKLDDADIPTILMPASQMELSVHTVRVSNAQLAVLITITKQSHMFASNPNLEALLRPTTEPSAPTVPLQQQAVGPAVGKQRTSRGSALLKRSDSVLSAREIVAEQTSDPTVDSVVATLEAIDDVLEKTESSGCVNVFDDKQFYDVCSENYSRVLGTVPLLQAHIDELRSCLVLGTSDPKVLAESCARQTTNKRTQRQVSDAIMALFSPIARKFASRCSSSERALIARCCIFSLLYQFESTLALSKPSDGLALNKNAKDFASRAMLKLATIMQAPGFDAASIFVVDRHPTGSAALSTVQALCGFLKAQYGSSMADDVQSICREFDVACEPEFDGSSASVACTMTKQCEHEEVEERLIEANPDSRFFAILSQGSESNGSDDPKRIGKRLFDSPREGHDEDAQVIRRPKRPSNSRKLYGPDSLASLLPLQANGTTTGTSLVKQIRPQLAGYQITKLAAQKKLKRSLSVPAGTKEVPLRQSTLTRQSSTVVAETPLKRTRC